MQALLNPGWTLHHHPGSYSELFRPSQPEMAAARCPQVTALAWSAAGVLASASLDTTAQLHRLEAGSVCTVTLSGHQGRVTSLAFVDQGSKLVTASTDRTLRVWEVNSGACLHTLTGMI